MCNPIYSVKQNQFNLNSTLYSSAATPSVNLNPIDFTSTSTKSFAPNSLNSTYSSAATPSMNLNPIDFTSTNSKSFAPNFSNATTSINFNSQNTQQPTTLITTENKAQFAAILQKYFPSIAGVSNNGDGSSISEEDLKKIANGNYPADIKTVAKTLLQNKNSLSQFAGKDGTIDQDGLQAAQMTPEEALKAIKENLDEKKSESKDFKKCCEKDNFHLTKDSLEGLAKSDDPKLKNAARILLNTNGLLDELDNANAGKDVDGKIGYKDIEAEIKKMDDGTSKVYSSNSATTNPFAA